MQTYRKTYEARQATNKLLELIDEGLLDRDDVILACVNYMSEDDVAGMCHANEYFDLGDEDEGDDELSAVEL